MTITIDGAKKNNHSKPTGNNSEFLPKPTLGDDDAIDEVGILVS